jgi:hypothetical protein
LGFSYVAHNYGPQKDHFWNEFFVVFDGPIFDLWESAGAYAWSNARSLHLWNLFQFNGYVQGSRGASSAAEKHLGHPADPGHLHFVYWQQTAKVIGEKNVLTTTTTPKKEGKAWTGGAHANLADFMDELQEMRKSEAKLPVNVISHDFVTSETCEKVIRLNPELKSA